MTLENLDQYSEEQRKELAGHYYQDGQLLVQQAETEDFKNTATLQQACAAFTHSIKIYSSDSRPFLSLANIFLHLEDFKTALQYVENALALNQYNILALDLKKRVELAQQKKLSTVDREKISLPHFVPIVTEDYDLLYDQIESWLHERVKELMEAGLPSLALTPMSFNALNLQLSQLKNEYDELLKILSIIDEELETSELYRMARPLEVYLERFQTLVFNSQRCLNLNNEIFGEAQILRRNIIRAKKIDSLEQLSELEEQLEIIQDKHERYRHQVDDLKRLKLPIHPIQTKWKMLEQILDHYREVLDDAIMQFL